MRGDSRRDLYAKTMALCGLGVLAGVGAVVDYWPVAIRFPVAAPIAESRVPSPPGIPEDVWTRVDRVRLDLARPDNEPARRHVAPATQPPRVLAVDAHTSRPMAVPTMPVVPDTGTVVLAGFVREVPPPSAAVLVRHEVPSFPGTLLDLESPALDRPTGHVSADRSDRGLLTSAFRVTGQSLARTGAVTGASLAGAFRRVGSAVRRVLP